MAVRRHEGSHAGDVGGEEVDAVAIEIASGAVVVLGGPGSAWCSTRCPRSVSR